MSRQIPFKEECTSVYPSSSLILLYREPISLVLANFLYAVVFSKKKKDKCFTEFKEILSELFH